MYTYIYIYLPKCILTVCIGCILCSDNLDTCFEFCHCSHMLFINVKKNSTKTEAAKTVFHWASRATIKIVG